MTVFRPICTLIYLAFALVFISAHAEGAESVPVDGGKAVVQLVTSYDSVQPGQDIHIALSFRLDKHWHTYWRNAGGPGEPVAINWTIPESLSVGEMIWPLPITVNTGPIINYAFEDKLLLPMPLHISENAVPGQVLNIEAQAAYLICYEVCIPELVNLTLPLLVGEPVKDSRWHGNIAREIKKTPKIEAGFAAAAQLEDKTLHIDFSGPDLAKGQYKNPYFFPYVQDLIEASDPQIVSVGKNGVRISMTAGYALDTGLSKAPQGVLVYDKKTNNGWQRHGVVVQAALNTTLDIGPSTSLTPATGASIGLWAAIIGAFLGGMLLNLMPCVFPVLSLKVLGFAKAAHEDGATIRRHGWLYTFGVLISFLILAGLLLALKASGAELGWGFQLQNPVVVAGLALLFFIIALNLFGLFSVGGGFQNTGASWAKTSSAKGAFFTGVLAVIVATPCTAPFMAGALGFALAQTFPMTLAVFMALGFGFALPFLILSHAPALLARLPKPGVWMETFKQFLAFPMLATSIWLIWVLTHLSGADGAARILMAMFLTGFAIWLWKRGTKIAKALTLAALLLAGYFTLSMKFSPVQTSTAQNAEIDPWSPERVTALRAAGHIVFVDFTASWCVSCKVNEVVVLDSQKTKDLFARTNTKTLIADWTRKDDTIAAELARHGRAGIPLYLVYPPGTTPVSPQILPQVLRYKILKNALEKAGN